MPFYIYIDEKTGESHEILMSVGEMERRERPDGTIEHEGKTLVRSIVAEHRHVPGTPGCWPMLSDAAGVHPNQCGEAFTASVRDGVPTRFHPETGQAIFESRSHRRAYLKSRGLYDRNGGYGD
jgi:hypothetical protein